MEMAMVQKLLAAPAKRERLWPPTRPAKRFLPVDGQPFQLLQKLAVEQWLGVHGIALDLRGGGLRGYALR